MYGINRQSGFTFIELIVVLMIIGVLMTVVLPTFNRRTPAQQRNELHQQLNSLMRLGWQQALVTQTIHRLFFDLKKRTVRLERNTDKKDMENKPVFELVNVAYTKSMYQWPEMLQLSQLFIDGQDVLARQGMKIFEAWFFIVPSGLSQAVILNWTDASEKDNNGESVAMSLVLNPFQAQFKQYEKFQKP